MECSYLAIRLDSYENDTFLRSVFNVTNLANRKRAYRKTTQRTQNDPYTPIRPIVVKLKRTGPNIKTEYSTWVIFRKPKKNPCVSSKSTHITHWSKGGLMRLSKPFFDDFHWYEQVNCCLSVSLCHINHKSHTTIYFWFLLLKAAC